MKNKKKTGLICGILLAVVIAAGLGVWYAIGHSSSDPVYVYDFNLIGMTEFWGDSRDSYGPVRTDRIQTVILTDTQTVTEIKVSEGDTVKKGDLLMTFDTTLSDLELEKKRLAVEKLKLQLEDEQDRLQEIYAMRPMQIPSSDTTPSQDSGVLLDGLYQIFPESDSDYDGSTQDRALICWVRTDQAVTASILSAIRTRAQELQSSHPVDPDDDGISISSSESAGACYVVFKQTADNMSLGSLTVWQGMRVNADNSFLLFDATGIPDYSREKQDDPFDNQIDLGSGYTAAQLAQMRRDQERKIQDVEYQIRMAESEYKIMQTEMVDGNVYAQIDGAVVSVLTEEAAKQDSLPIIKVSGGGGFYVEGSVSELEKDLLEIGQEVQVNDYRSGAMYTGTVQSIGDYPTANNGYSGMGNPNASSYPFTVFVDGSADLTEGLFVDIQYTIGKNSGGVYLENPFVRTENGKSFVYVQGANGRLERRDVVTGKRLWGSYIEIRSGVTSEDKIAFPYGKSVKPGVSTVSGDYSNLNG